MERVLEIRPLDARDEPSAPGDVMDELHDPEMAMWQAAIAAFRERQNTPVEAFENAELLLAAYRRRRAESRDDGEADLAPDTAQSEEGADVLEAEQP
jgi:hypothetical protein